VVEAYWQPTNTPVLDAHGAVSALLHQVVNVMARVQAEAQLRASHTREPGPAYGLHRLARAVDVTDQVLACRQLEHLNEELETRVQQRTR